MSTSSLSVVCINSRGQGAVLLSAEDVGIYKPSRRVYRLAMQKLAIHEAPSVAELAGLF